MDMIERVIEKFKAEGNDVVAVSKGWKKVRQVSHIRADISDAVMIR